MPGIEQKRKAAMKPAFAVFAYSAFSEGYLHSMRNVPNPASLALSPLLWLQFREVSAMRGSPSAQSRSRRGSAPRTAPERCASPGSAAEPLQGLHSSRVPLEISVLRTSPCYPLPPSDTPRFALCVCTENAATAASISPSHSSFQTGKPPEPSFFFSPLSLP